MKRILLLLTLVAVVAAFAGVASTTASAAPTLRQTCSTDHVSFAKTKFAIHMGAAIASFKHFVYDPYKAGAFKKGAPGRTKALVKAGATALFDVHELKIACQDANSSPTLKHLVTPLQALFTQLGVLGRKLKSGSFDPGDITSIGGELAHVGG